LAAGKPIGVSSVGDWEIVGKNADSNPYKGAKDPKTGKDTAKPVKKVGGKFKADGKRDMGGQGGKEKEDKDAMKKLPGGGRNMENTIMPPVTEALQAGVSMYIAGAAVPRFVSNTGVASDKLKRWNTGLNGIGYMVD